MHEKSLESFEASGLNPRNIGIIVALLMLCIMLWGTFVIVRLAAGGSFSGGAVSKSGS
jgi:hypothetical protein